VCICVPQSGMVSLFLFGLENLAEKTRFYRLVTQDRAMVAIGG